ncbi:hypothetical protein FRB98_001655 [Tulasnella sp. 332]|nr:hypothetical protein FRB98_001655 [Tulasnella sp. 332]
MECRLTQAAPGDAWKCQVSLRYEFNDETGKRQSEVREKLFGPLVTDPSLLEDVLRRAQLAILNPSVDHGKFVDFDLSLLNALHPPLGSTKQLQFSKNVVCLDLAGESVTDLSFIDLPGIISNVAPGEDRGNIDLVRNLVTEHIQGNCLILLTLTMRDDLENQSAAFLAKQVDPKGRRTIGVLTKPDTLQHGEEGAWLAILEGQRHPLFHGYYMTKQPATRELLEKLSWEAAREREKEYFDSTPIWAKSSATNRLGTANLTKNLSRLLSGLIDQTLPKLRLDASRSRENTRQLLTKLPPAISENPSAELLRMISTFSSEFRNYTTGLSEYASLIQQCKPAYEGFRDAIRATAPDFRPYTAKEKRKYAQLTVRFKDPEDDEEKSNSDEDEEDEDEDDDDDDDEDSDEDGKSGKSKKTEPMYVDEVQKYIHGSLTRELPFNVPFSAKEGLIRKSMKEWEEHALDCFNIVRECVADQLDTLVEKHFGRFARTTLLDTVFAIIQRLIEKRQDETVTRLKWLIKLEHRPYTQNHHYLSSYRDKYLSKYRGERRKKNKAREEPGRAGSPVNSNRAPTPDMFPSLDSFMQSPQTMNSPLQGPRGAFPSRGTPMRSNSTPLMPQRTGMPPQQQQQQLPPPQQQPMMQQPQQQAQPNIENLLSQLSAAGYPVKSHSDLERLFASDPYEEVMVVMAEVRAYWQVAFKRIIDILPLAIDEDFLCGLEQETMDTLMEGLGMVGADNSARAAEFLAEDPEIVEQRDQLAAKLARVEDVFGRLSKFKS